MRLIHKTPEGTLTISMSDADLRLCETVLFDCIQSLKRLSDVDGAYRVTCIQQAETLRTRLERLLNCECEVL